MQIQIQIVRLIGILFCLFEATQVAAQMPAPPVEAVAPVAAVAPVEAGAPVAPDAVVAPSPAVRVASDSASVFRVAVPGNVFSRLEKSAPTGVFIETMDSILRKMGRNPTYINMPTGEALNDLKDGTISAATVVVPSARIKDTAYLSDPIIREYNIAVTLKNKGFSLASIADLHGKNIGARIGYQYPLLEQDKNIELMRYPTDGEMLRSLLFGTIDVAMISGISDIYTLRSEGIITRLEMLKYSVGMVPLVVAFSKVHFSKESVDAFNHALTEFRKTDEWSAILERNGMADLVKDWPILKQ